MSLVALALRMSAVRAMTGDATLVGSRVFDSAIMPIDRMIGEDRAPFIAVSTEDEAGKPSGRDLNTGDRTIDLVIELAVGSVVPMEGIPPEGGDAIQLVVPETDGNLELALAVITRQITACLFGRGGGAWGDVFRLFTGAVEEYSSRRGVPNKDGQRFAARQLVFRIKAFAEPAFGQEPEAGTPFAKFLAAIEADSDLDKHAAIIRRALSGAPIGWPELFTQAAVDAGLTEEEAQGIGIAPIGGLPSDALISMTVQPEQFVADAASIAEALEPEAD